MKTILLPMIISSAFFSIIFSVLKCSQWKIFKEIHGEFAKLNRGFRLMLEFSLYLVQAILVSMFSVPDVIHGATVGFLFALCELFFKENVVEG